MVTTAVPAVKFLVDMTQIFKNQRILFETRQLVSLRTIWLPISPCRSGGHKLLRHTSRMARINIHAILYQVAMDSEHEKARSPFRTLSKFLHIFYNVKQLPTYH
jgi:hypothetical protein